MAIGAQWLKWLRKPRLDERALAGIASGLIMTVTHTQRIITWPADSVVSWWCTKLGAAIRGGPIEVVSWEKTVFCHMDGNTEAHNPFPEMRYLRTSPKHCVRTSIWSYFWRFLFASHAWAKEAHLFLALFLPLEFGLMFQFRLLSFFTLLVSFASSLKFTLSVRLLYVYYCYSK